MDEKKKRKYIIPEAEIVEFDCEDIITRSGADDWANDDNWETF
jgi:hypothetical protein